MAKISPYASLLLVVVLGGCASILGLDEVHETTPDANQSDAATDALPNDDATSTNDGALRDASPEASDDAAEDAASDALDSGFDVDSAVDGAVDPCASTAVSWGFETATAPALFTVDAPSNASGAIVAGEGKGGGAAYRVDLPANGSAAGAWVLVDLASLPTKSGCSGGFRCTWDVRYTTLGSSFFGMGVASTKTAGEDYLTLARYSGGMWLATYANGYVGQIASPYSANAWYSVSVKVTGSVAPFTTVVESNAVQTTTLAHKPVVMRVGADKTAGDPALTLYVDNISCSRVP